MEAEQKSEMADNITSRRTEEKSEIRTPGRGRLVWSGRPSIGSYVAIYGVVSAILIIILVTAEWWIGNNYSIGSTIFPRTILIGKTVVPYPVEIATAVIIALAFVGEIIRLALVRARSKYELYEDGLYVNLGIVNLESTFLSPIAFSDARLIRTLSMRIVNRGLIIVDANDERHFYLRLIKNPVQVQSLIRSTLAHPTVRVE